MLPGESSVFFFLRLSGEEFIVKHLAHAPAHPHPQFFYWGAPLNGLARWAEGEEIEGDKMGAHAKHDLGFDVGKAGMVMLQN